MPPGLRACLYDTAGVALHVGGLGAGRLLAGEALGALVTELYGLGAAQQAALASGAAAGGKPGGPPAKKARTGGGAGDPLAGVDVAAAAVAAADAAPVSSGEVGRKGRRASRRGHGLGSRARPAVLGV
jgi:hypothetical protein